MALPGRGAPNPCGCSGPASGCLQRRCESIPFGGPPGPHCPLHGGVADLDPVDDPERQALRVVPRRSTTEDEVGTGCGAGGDGGTGEEGDGREGGGTPDAIPNLRSW